MTNPAAHFVELEQFPGYYIHPDGRVLNIKTGNILSNLNHDEGYIVVAIENSRPFLHRLLAETFIPNPRGCKQINHIDCNRANYDLANLEWVHPAENSRRTKLHLAGGGFTEEIVRMIRAKTEWKRGDTKKMAARLGVPPATISNIKNGWSWKGI